MAYISSHRVSAPSVLDLIGTVVASVKATLARHAVYVRTLNELNALSDRDLADLNLSRHMIRDVASQAAYGH